MHEKGLTQTYLTELCLHSVRLHKGRLQLWAQISLSIPTNPAWAVVLLSLNVLSLMPN